MARQLPFNAAPGVTFKRGTEPLKAPVQHLQLSCQARRFTASQCRAEARCHSQGLTHGFYCCRRSLAAGAG